MNYTKNAKGRAMKTMLMIAPHSSRGNHVTETLKTAITEMDIQKCKIYSYFSKDGSDSLISELGLNESDKVEILPLGTTGYKSKLGLQEIHWKVLEKMVNSINSCENPVVILGRGSRSYDHLMWLSALISDAEVFHIDGLEVVCSEPNAMLKSAPSTRDLMAAILERKAYGFINGYHSSTMEYFGVEDFRESDLAPSGQGLNSSIQGGTNLDLLEVHSEGNSISYGLTPKGWFKALDIWTMYRNERFGGEIHKKLLITFGRLHKPLEESDPSDPRHIFNMIQYVQTLAPFDSILPIFQRHDNDFVGCRVTGIEQALEDYHGTEWYSHLNLANITLRGKSLNEGIGLCEPIVIVNPDGSSQMWKDVMNAIWRSWMRFENDNGKHNLLVDITSPMKELTSLVSNLAYGTNSSIVSALRSQKTTSATGGEVQESQFSIADHRLDIPSRFAAESLSGIEKVSSRKNVLMTMLLMDKGVGQDKPDDLSFLMVKPKEKKVDGYTWKMIESQAEGLSIFLEINLQDGITNVRTMQDLINLNFVYQSSAEGKRAWRLTPLGHFIGEYFFSKLGVVL